MPLTIFAKNLHLDALQAPVYISAHSKSYTHGLKVVNVLLNVS